MKTGLYTNPIFLEHNTGQHPENANRLRAILDKLESDKLMGKFKVEAGRTATSAEIKMLHTEKLISEVETASESGAQTLHTRDCVISAQTYKASLHAVGSVLDAALEVAERRLDNAFCAVRPPGHHAEFDTAMGFCFFNNIALAAEFLSREMGFQRILIIDFDVHHGNGTQHFFEERSDIFFVSMHQDPRTCYPGTGFAKENGRGVGTGYTLNVPVPPGIEDAEYLQIFSTDVKPKLEEYNPDFVLISAGFDAHRDDPLASLNLTESTFKKLSFELKRLAEQTAGGRMLSMLEGGYDLNALSSCVSEHLQILASDE
ncbi:MAG: histone deacetylase [SAR324 cluster bacterium]|nr:histone deacetylase [SAR324 cluster bacterium]|tara:strand:- start:1424 stop:2371 length:948 start_codon:yes stop_codon:yes gene_type:complete